MSKSAAESARLQFFALSEPSPDSRGVFLFARRKLKKQVLHLPNEPKITHPASEQARRDENKISPATFSMTCNEQILNLHRSVSVDNKQNRQSTAAQQEQQGGCGPDSKNEVAVLFFFCGAKFNFYGSTDAVQRTIVIQYVEIFLENLVKHQDILWVIMKFSLSNNLVKIVLKYM